VSSRSPEEDHFVAPVRKRSIARALAVTLSVGVHLSILAALLSARRDGPMLVEPSAIAVSLVQPARPPSPAPPKPAPTSAVAKSASPRPMAKPKPVRAAVDTLPADETPTPVSAPGLSDGELAGAATADSGGGGGACNMVRRLQGALRKDELVQAAARAPGAAGKALKVWNGDWLATPGEDGRGLSAVREAIMWEVGFAPAACRAEPVHGLVVISLTDAPGSTRLAMGGGEWRWSDLLSSPTMRPR